MSRLERAERDFERMMKAGYLDGLIIYELADTLAFSKEHLDDELTEALKVVLAYYTNEQEYEDIMKEVG